MRTGAPVTSPDMVGLSKMGLAVRLAATVLVAGLLVSGTVWGDDDHFPFGPFRMYSTTADADEPTRDTRVEAVAQDGRTVRLTERNTGVRRAEVEGQLARLREDPSLLATLADAYASRNPDATALREIRIVVRWHEVRDFRPTGAWHDEVVVVWQP